MTSTLEDRVRDLEQRVAILEAGRAVLPGHVQVSPITGVAPASPPAAESDQLGAEALFDALTAGGSVSLISYSEAYKRIVGPYDTWRNAVHAPEIVRLARQTAVRRVRGLEVRLDALIVGKETRRPAKGHFQSASYSEAEWIHTFGAAPLME